MARNALPRRRFFATYNSGGRLVAKVVTYYGRRSRFRARKVLVSMGTPMSVMRNALQALPFILLVWGCNDILGFHEGKPYPDGGTHSDASVPDGADAPGPSEASSVDAPDAPDTDSEQVDGGDAGCRTPACG